MRVFAQDPLDDHLLRKRLVIVHGPVDVRAEVAVDAEQLGLLLDERLVGAAGQVEREPAALKLLQQRARPVNEQIVLLDLALAQALEAADDPRVEPAQVLVLVPERIARLAAAFAIRSASWIIW